MKTRGRYCKLNFLLRRNRSDYCGKKIYIHKTDEFKTSSDFYLIKRVTLNDIRSYSAIE